MDCERTFGTNTKQCHEKDKGEEEKKQNVLIFRLVPLVQNELNVTVRPQDIAIKAIDIAKKASITHASKSAQKKNKYTTKVN